MRPPIRRLVVRALRMPAVGAALLLGAMAAAAPAQKPPPGGGRERGAPPLRRFGREELGLTPLVRDVAEGVDGLVHVIAADQYVLRFDGARWHRTFVPQPRLRALLALPDGSLWAGGAGGAGRLVPRPDGGFDYRPAPPMRLLPPPPVGDAAASRPARLFGDVTAAAVVDGVVYAAAERSIVIDDGRELRLDVDPSFDARSVGVVDGAVFVGGRDGRVKRRAGDGWVDACDPDALGRGDVVAILTRAEGAVAVTTAGLYVLDASGARPLFGEGAGLLAKLAPTSAASLPDGGFAIGTARGGVLLLDAHGRPVRRIATAAGLVDETVHAVRAERNGGLWIACDDGLYAADLGSPVETIDLLRGGSGRPAFLRRFPAGMRLGTTRDLLLLETTALGAEWRLVGGRHSLDGCFAAAELGPDLWCGGRGGLFRIAPGARPERRARGDVYALESAPVDGARGLLVGSSRGLFAVAENGGRCGPPADGAGAVRAILVAPDGRAYLQTDVGPRVVRPPYGVAAAPELRPLGDDAVSPAAGFALVEGRVCLIDGAAVVPLGADDRPTGPSLADFGPHFYGQAYALVAAADGALYAATTSGLWIGRRDAGGVYRFAPRPELPFAPGEAAATAVDPDGRIFWADGLGFRVFDPARVVPPPVAPRPRIERVTFEGDDVRPITSFRPVERVDGADPARRRAFVEFGVEGVDPARPLEFSWRLAGVRDRFSPFSSEPYAAIAALPDGEASLEVRARYARGPEAAAAPLVLVARPPWRRTAAARVVYFAGGSVAVALGVAAVLRGLRRRNRELERVVAVRTAELAAGKAEALQLAGELSALFAGSHTPAAELRCDVGGAAEPILLRRNRAFVEAFGERAETLFTTGGPAAAAVRDVLRTGEVVDVAVDVPGPDGPPRRFALRLSASDGGGRLLVSAVDESERHRRAEERRREDLRRLEAARLEALGLIAGGVAHDFNNLLTAILGNLHFAAERVRDDESAAALGRAERASEQAADLCRQMLAGAGRSDLARERVFPAAEAAATAELLRAAAGRRARLVFDLDPNTPAVYAAPAEIRRVLLNLLTNAAEALPDGAGTITVAAGRARFDVEKATVAGGRLPPGDYAWIRVDDDGPGVPPALRDRIFEPFFSTKLVGRGLGLAATLGVLRAAGGGVEIDASPAGGARFTLYLPAAAPERASDGPPPSAESARDAAAPPTPAVAAPAAAPAATVLVVDDEPAVLDVSVRALARAGFVVSGAGDGESALARVAAGPPPALVVTDWTMPGLAGAELLVRLRAAAPQASFLVVSGYAEEEIRAAAGKDPGPTTFLRKPYAPRTLVEACRRLLAPAPAA